MTNIKVDNRAHLTISQWISYISDGRDIHPIQHVHDLRPITHNEAYKHDRVATLQPEAIDLGWVQEPFYIAVINKEIETDHLLYLSFSKSKRTKNKLIIPPQSCQLFFPLDSKAVFLSAKKAKTKYTIHVFPR